MSLEHGHLSLINDEHTPGSSKSNKGLGGSPRSGGGGGVGGGWEIC